MRLPRELAWVAAAAAAGYAFGAWRFGAAWWSTTEAWFYSPYSALSLPTFRSPYGLAFAAIGARLAWVTGRFGWRQRGRVALATGALALCVAAIAALVFVLVVVFGRAPLGEDAIWLMLFAIVGAQCWLVAAAVSLAAALRAVRNG